MIIIINIYHFQCFFIKKMSTDFFIKKMRADFFIKKMKYILFKYI
jgi:hypothetical protein